MKWILLMLFVLTVQAESQAQLQTGGPISIQQIANYMYSIGELTLAEKNGPLSVGNLNAKSRLVNKIPPLTLKDWYGYWTCGTNFKLTHTANTVAPVTKTVIYGTVQTSVSGASKCWITQNLGADHSATTVNDITEASGGWYWQFNRPQGYKIADDGITPVHPILHGQVLSVKRVIGYWLMIPALFYLEQAGGYLLILNG